MLLMERGQSLLLSFHPLQRAVSSMLVSIVLSSYIAMTQNAERSQEGNQETLNDQLLVTPPPPVPLPTMCQMLF